MLTSKILHRLRQNSQTEGHRILMQGVKTPPTNSQRKCVSLFSSLPSPPPENLHEEPQKRLPIYTISTQIPTKTVTPTTLVCSQRTTSHRTQISLGITTVYKAIVCPKTMASLAQSTAWTLVSLWRKWPRQSGRGRGAAQGRVRRASFLAM